VASDTFTGADDTPLATHDAAWENVNASYPVSAFEIWGNTCRTTGTFSSAGARRTDSTEDTSEAVLPAQTTTDTALVRSVAVRLDGTTRGYAIRFRSASGGNWTAASFTKNGTFVGDFGAGSWAMNAAHTLKITAEQSGANVILHGFVDGAEVGTGITDSASPYAAGNNPGFWAAGNGTIANNTFDDWTDAASAGSDDRTGTATALSGSAALGLAVGTRNVNGTAQALAGSATLGLAVGFPSRFGTAQALAGNAQLGLAVGYANDPPDVVESDPWNPALGTLPHRWWVRVSHRGIW
jgi:hypothetical protein